MQNLIISSDLVNHKISIIQGFKVDYNPNIKGKDYNNNGTWGKISDPGVVVQCWNYDPNKHHNFQSDYEVMLSYVKRQLEVFKALQPKQIEAIIKDNK